MTGLWTAFLDLLYPPKCALCQTLLKREETALCAKCRAALPDTPPEDRHGEFFSRCIVCLPYAGSIREAFLRYKFQGRTSYAALFGSLLAMRILQEAPEYDLLTWVPISAKRRRSRGYDQTRLLAEVAARELGVTLTATLQKTRNNAPQSSKASAAERRANVLNHYRALHPEQLRGKQILLLDDICTTGATLSECSRVLLTAGASSVVCAAFAAPEKKPDENKNRLVIS